MSRAHPSAAYILATAIAITALSATAQSWPQKPVRIVTGAAGGGNDTTARLAAQVLTASLGQSVVVENRPGIGVIPAQTVATAPPDGYTILVYANTVWLLPFLQSNPPYDPLKDLAPVTLVSVIPQLLVVNPSLPVKSVKDVIALAKAKPGALNYSTSGVGSVNHLAGELFKSMAKVNIIHVPYKGTALGITDLIGGRVEVSFPTAASVSPYVKTGRLRALAVTTAKPSVLFPDIPTVSASGLPGYSAAALLGMLAPAGTPAAVINRLQQDMQQAISKPDGKEPFLKAGMEPVGGTPAELAATIKADMTTMGKVIREAGIRAE